MQRHTFRHLLMSIRLTKPPLVAPLEVQMPHGWQPWNYHEDRLKTAKKVENFKNSLRNPSGKERGKVTKYIAQNKSRQELLPPLGKYVDIVKPDTLHNTSNAWQQWFMTTLAVAMQYTEDNQLKAVTLLSDMPSSSVVVKFLHCIKDGPKCALLFKNFARWFSEKRKKGMPLVQIHWVRV